MQLFSKETQEILISSGWNKNRKVNIISYEICLKREGYLSTTPVRKFLSEYGGLKISFQTDRGQEFFHFDVCKATKDFDPKWIEEDYIKRIPNSFNICVLGQAFNNHLTLLMNGDGVIYGGYDDILYFIGIESDAIDALITRKGIVEL